MGGIRVCCSESTSTLVPCCISFSINKLNSIQDTVLFLAENHSFIDKTKQWLLSISLILPHQPSHVPGQSLFFSSHLLLVALFFFFFLLDVRCFSDPRFDARSLFFPVHFYMGHVGPFMKPCS